MRTPLLSVALGLVLAVPSGAAASDGATAASTAALCQQVKQRKTVIVDKTKPEIVWSDGAMFEVARTFPRELQELIDAPTATRDLHTLLSRMSGKAEEGWLDAKTPRPPRGGAHAIVESTIGSVTLHLASPYFNYLHERYPGARLRIKGPLDPILFFVDGTVRAAVMPIAMPPAGAKK